MAEEKKAKVFVDGMRFEAPSDIMKEKTPWIKGKVSIKAPDLIAFLEKHQSTAGWVKINLCKSQKGGLYFELNTWKPKKVEVDTSDEPCIDPETGVDLNPKTSAADIPF